MSIASLPDEIKSMRERMGLSQAELAALLHVNPKIPSRWEHGVTPQPSTLAMLSRLHDDFHQRPRLFARLKREALA